MKTDNAPAFFAGLSIRQPWAEQVLTGVKTIEYRSWKCSHRGPLLLHASKTKGEPGSEGLPTGCLVGIAWMTDCEPPPSNRETAYRWHLGCPARFAAPIMYKGAVGILRVPADVVWDCPLVANGETITLADWLERAALEVGRAARD